LGLLLLAWFCLPLAVRTSSAFLLLPKLLLLLRGGDGLRLLFLRPWTGLVGL
jgi:hypothetical protein